MDLFDLFCKISLDDDDFRHGLDENGKKVSSFGDKLKKGFSTAGKVAAAGMAAATTAVGALTKASLDSYSNYEQLVGGVETLFGAGGKSLSEYAKSEGKMASEVMGEYSSLMSAQQAVMSNAANAYRTAGMSANEYMETVTSFSASLLQSLEGNTQEAAQVADMAVTDMADNANKMGTDVAMIQNAYQGFAKQNYTMLDNLKLGYGGTKEEMQRLIDDANRVREANGEMGDLSIDSFADVTEAIHLMQEEMGIAGTTQAEASETIQGSLASMRGAWDNLITGVADGSVDMGVLIDNFVVSVDTAAQNIVPRLGEIIGGLGTVVQGLAPVIAEQLPAIIETTLPVLMESGGSLLQAVMEGIIAALPTLTSAAVDLVTSLGQFIIENLPLLIDAAFQILMALANGLIEALPDMIPQIVQIIVFLGQTLIEHIPELLEAAYQIVVGIFQGLMEAFPELAQFWESLKQGFQEAWDAIKGVWDAVTGFFSDIWNGIKDTFHGIGDWFEEKFTNAKEHAVGAWDDVEQTFSDMWENIKKTFRKAIDKLKGFFDFEWNLPKIKLPHFSITGSFSLDPPSIPHFSVDWYRKAMDNAMLLSGPTIFGMSGGKLLGGGEAGTEVVSGAGTLMDMIGRAVRQNARPAGAGTVINISVNAANIQDDQALAERIAFELRALVDRRAAAFGTA